MGGTSEGSGLGVPCGGPGPRCWVWGSQKEGATSFSTGENEPWQPEAVVNISGAPLQRRAVGRHLQVRVPLAAVTLMSQQGEIILCHQDRMAGPWLLLAGTPSMEFTPI